MDFDWSILRSGEQTIYRLRGLYEKYGYRRFKMSKFEAYDLYVRNKDFLVSDRMITFTDARGVLMALKPDVTLSILKNTREGEPGPRKVYYNEAVYRTGKGDETFQEIMQTGLECIGDLDLYHIYEVIALAVGSLASIHPEYILNVSHLGLVSGFLEAAGVDPENYDGVLAAVRDKNMAALTAFCREKGLSGTVLSLLFIFAVLAAGLSFIPRKGTQTCAVAFGILTLILVPAFSMTFTRFFTRTIGTVLSGARQADITGELALADKLLYGGQGGDRISALLSGMSFSSTPWMWLLLIPAFGLICGTVMVQNIELSSALSRGFLYAFVIALCVLILYPYYVMFITAVRTPAETNDMHFLHMLPVNWMWGNFGDIVRRNVLTYLGNSLLLSIGATVISLLCGIPAAYAMARMKFRGRRAFLGFVIMSQMFSPVVLLVGISRLMIGLKLNDSVLGLMLINAAFNQAFAIWLLRGTFVSISSEMEQAACIDGCSVVGALIRVLLPMAAPGIVTTLIFVFINSWNEYTISTVLISTPARKPITVGITQFSSFNMIEWHYLFASALLATIPVVILFMFIEKHLVSGLTSGGVKG